MAVNLYEVYDVETKFRESRDRRPAVVIEPPSPSGVPVALISGAMDLYQGPAVHFRLDPTHPDFPATGLKKDCYIAGDEIYTIRPDQLIHRRGKLQGELRARLERWI
jgi:mRNA-degrading endonuclease toxin of MazEF toxin-antitoxin module